MWGPDIERDKKAWELTTELCKFNKKPKLTKKLISMAFDEASKFFDMSKFPSTDDGNFEQLKAQAHSWAPASAGMTDRDSACTHLPRNCVHIIL
jgi:hypothetical protein